MSQRSSTGTPSISANAAPMEGAKPFAQNTQPKKEQNERRAEEVNIMEYHGISWYIMAYYDIL